MQSERDSLLFYRCRKGQDRLWNQEIKQVKRSASDLMQSLVSWEKTQIILVRLVWRLTASWAPLYWRKLSRTGALPDFVLKLTSFLLGIKGSSKPSPFGHRRICRSPYAWLILTLSITPNLFSDSRFEYSALQEAEEFHCTSFNASCTSQNWCAPSTQLQIAKNAV